METKKFENIEKDVLSGATDLSKDHVELAKAIYGIKEFYEEEEFKAMLDDVHSNMDTAEQTIKKTRTFILRPILSIAAAILVIVVPVYFIFFNAPTTSSDIYDQYYETYPNLMTMRSSDSDNKMALAGKAYEIQNFDEAYRLLQNEAGELASFYRATSLMEMDKHSEAIQAWEEHLSEYTFLERQSKFRLGLSYYKLNSSAQGLLIMTELTEGKDEVAENARAIVK